MRAGQSTIQQTLTTEAASVLNQSIAEAGRRNHGQTTPLHVAATLLAAPTAYLRQACIRSHPNSSHPLQCRALELCFSVALERLPSAASAGSVSQPPISNALMAALKRAQAHQRRGCPEQQQQPLLAVKVELEQLIISILDDPSVSRVMREASFSSPAVKAAIEQSIASTSSSSSVVSSTPTPSSSSGGLGFRPVMAATTTLLQSNRGLYINPRLQHQHPKPQQPQQPRREEEVKKVLDVMVRSKKKNPVLVGDSELQSLMKEALGRIERKEIADGPLKTSHVISLEKDFTLDRLQIPCRMEGLANLIDSCLDAGRGAAILNLGDLKWLVENSNGIHHQHQQPQLLPEAGRAAVAEMGKLLSRFSGRVWLMGTASCATYLRCQVYHPTMESDWDLQAVPIAPRAPVSGMFPRNGGTGLPSSPAEVLAPRPHKGLFLSAAAATTSSSLPSRRPPESTDPLRRTMCPACTEEYERELGRLVAEEFEKASSNSKAEACRKLPPWLQAAKINGGNAASLQTREQELKWKQSAEGLLERWRQTCSSLHPCFRRQLVSSDGPVQTPHSPITLPLESLQHRPSPVGMTNVAAHASVKLHVSPPGSPVRTDLVLGRPVTCGATTTNHGDCIKDSIGWQLEDRIGGNLDADSFKRLFKGLAEKVAWQPDAAASVAVTVAQCRSGEGRRKAARTKADTWLLFLGHDKVGKKKMASALSEILFGTAPTTVSISAEGRLADVDGGSSTAFRGKTALGRMAEAVRQNPFAVFVIEDVDRADVLVRGGIKKAIESGRLPDSHGREISLGGGVFIVTADSLPERFKHSSMESFVQCEEKLDAIANCGWQLELLLVGETNGKRHGDLLEKMNRASRARTDSGAAATLSLDLNLATRTLEEDARDGSRNSSDLTVEHDLQHGLLNLKPPSSTSLPIDMMDVVDDTIVFKPVDFDALRKKVSDTILHKFNSVVGAGRQLQVDADALDRVVAGVWFRDVGAPAFEEWTKNVLLPCFQQLRSNQAFVGTSSVARLVPIRDERGPSDEGLPTKITICRW